MSLNRSTTQMSVRFSEIGDGLFETHVSLDDVNEVIGEQFYTQSRFKVESKLTPIGDGNGFSSKVILVEPKWTIPDESLPNKFVLKIISCQHLKALLDISVEEGAMTPETAATISVHFGEVTQKLHNQEMKFYRIIEKFRIASNKTKGFVGMEYVEGSVVKHVYENVKPEDLHPILEALAAIQSIELSDEERHSIESSLFADTFKGMVEEHGISGIFEKTKSIDRCRLEAKVEKLQMLGKELVNPDVALNLNEHIGIPKNILCHGDLWTANILWNSEGRVARLIDYQMIHFGNPAEDFVRLFTSTLSGEDRRKHWESLLETFYSYYLEKVRDHEGVGYTLEQLKESYRRYFVFGALTALPMFGPVVDLKLKEMPLEMQPEYQETVVRNLECLLEDIEEFYLYSKSKE